MKIIATIGNWILVESKSDFIFYDYKNKSKTVIPKKKNPNTGIAAIVKYGYLRLKKPKSIKSLDEINEDLIKEIRKITVGQPHF